MGFHVPTSQSDEEDLAPIKGQAQLPTPTLEGNENMDVSEDDSLFCEPTTKATSTNCHTRTPNSINQNMDVSEDDSLFSEPTTKATSTNCHTKTPNSTNHPTGQMLTPPLTVSLPTPIPLDPATKTAQIIAQIKERAYAKTHSSPEVAPLEFIDDLEDSDDDFLLPVLPLVTKPARCDLISLPTHETMN